MAMDKISEVLDSIKERLNNPFFGSLLIAWIFCNWEITIALLWYDESLWKGHNNIIEFIYRTRGWWRSLIFPITIAISYVILNPLLKNTIKLINLHFDNWGNKRQEQMSNDTRVHFDAFREKFNELKERENSLAAIQNEQIQTKNRVSELESLLSQSRNDVAAKQQLLEEQRKNTSQQLELHQTELNNLKTQASVREKDLQKTIQSYTENDIIGLWLVTYTDSTSDNKKYILFTHLGRSLSYNKTKPIDPNIDEMHLEVNFFLRQDAIRIFVATKREGFDKETKVYYYLHNISDDSTEMKGYEDNKRITMVSYVTIKKL